jgi:hypothetical protein
MDESGNEECECRYCQCKGRDDQRIQPRLDIAKRNEDLRWREFGDSGAASFVGRFVNASHDTVAKKRNAYPTAFSI